MLKTSLLILIAISTIPLFAFAESSIELSSDQNNVGSLDSVLVYGKVTGVKPYSTVNLSVIAPDGETVFSPNVTFDNEGNFKRLIHPPLPSFKPGTYTVIASHEDIPYTAQMQFTVSGKDLTRGIIAESTSTSQMKDKTDLDMYIIADAKIGETIIDIRGKTIWVDRDVSLAVSSPNGNLITVAQITPTSNGDFSTKINIGGTMWKEDGTYTVTAFQGDASELKDSVKVEIAKGVVVPEFGTIAMMVLAVAIISIIVVTTKSRVIPKF
ncbi:MAG: PEFG-CTERM sorting domain-containing protein [Nitrosopumilus sp.]|nr:PEFG-CTERM sorting domain-containing protein [Nitrosopumilus sp.]